MMIKKVLLMSTPAYTFKAGRDVNPLPPMGLGYLAAALEKIGIEVRILDTLVRGWDHEEVVNDLMVRIGMSDKDIVDAITDFGPDLVGINCLFSRQYRIHHQMFALIKNISPDIITMAGGAHTTACPEEVLNDPLCDYIIQGEGEESLRDFINKFNAHEDVSSVDGLGLKENGILVINEKKAFVSNLDSLAFPAYHLMNLEQYFGLEASHGPRHRKRFMPIITSRGCPAKCSFCTAYKVWGRSYRMRSIENVIAEMRLLKDRYGIEEMMFEDDNVTANRTRAAQLFTKMIEEKFDFIWDTPNGVGIWSLDEATIDLMQKSGCIRLNFPIESGSQRVLKEIIRKPVDLKKAKRLMRYCRRIGLDYGMFLVIGMPGETLNDMWSSFRFAADCGAYHPHISVATPYPGSELFEVCKKNGYFSREFSLDDLFIHSYLIRTPEWDEEKVKKIINRGGLYLTYREYRDHPFKAFKLLLKRPKNIFKIPQKIFSLIK